MAESMVRLAKKSSIPFFQRDDEVNRPIYPNENKGFIVSDAISPTGETSRFKILERMYVDEYFPQISLAYETVREAAEMIYQRPVITSPFYRSSINLNMYDEIGSRHAAHVDSNPIANLLCLAEGTPLQMKVSGEWIDVPLKPGELLTFNGREVMHRVPPSLGGKFRLVASLNLYFPDDCSRPDGLDEVAYGSR